MAADDLGGASQVSRHQAIQTQMLRAARRPLPKKRRPQGSAQPIVNRRVAFQQVESGR